MPRAGCRVMHSQFNLDACRRDRKFGGNRPYQHRGCLKGICYLFTPRIVLRPPIVVEPDLNRVAIIFLADAGEQVRVAGLT